MKNWSFEALGERDLMAAGLAQAAFVPPPPDGSLPAITIKELSLVQQTHSSALNDPEYKYIAIRRYAVDAALSLTHDVEFEGWANC